MSSIARQATDVKLLLNEAFSTNLDHTSYICEDNFSDFLQLNFHELCSFVCALYFWSKILEVVILKVACAVSLDLRFVIM